MSSETRSSRSKSSDPVAKAERKARKAAAAATAAAAAVAAADAPDATIAPAGGDDEQVGDPGPSRKKARRDREAREEDGDLLEIDVSAPTPLSKAEARAAKKRAKRGEGGDTAEAAKDEGRKKKSRARVNADRLSDVEDEISEGKSGKEDAERPKTMRPERKNSIWIGNVSFRTTPETLQAFLEKGVVELGGGGGCVTRVNLPKKPGRNGLSDNKGFAYVDLNTPEAQALAVGLSERLLEGRKLLIKLGDDHKANPDARTPKPVPVKSGSLPKHQPHPESSTLFMGNLPFDATEEAVRDMLESYALTVEVAGAGGEHEGEDEGAVVGKEEAGKRSGRKSGLRKVRLGQFEDTGRCKGFAFLDFLTPRHATSALSNRKIHYFQGRKLVLQYASAEATKRSGGDKKSLPEKLRGTKRPRSEHDDTAEGHDGTEDTPIERSQPRALRPKGAEDTPQAAGGKKGDQRGKKWEATGRPRPGAALAMAKREKVGIVEGGGGQKITFD